MPKQPQHNPTAEPQADSHGGRSAADYTAGCRIRWGRIRWGLQLKLVAAGILAGLFAGLAVLIVASPGTLAFPTVLYGLAAVFLFTLLLDFAAHSPSLSCYLRACVWSLLAHACGGWPMSGWQSCTRLRERWEWLRQYSCFWVGLCQRDCSACCFIPRSTATANC